MSGREGGANIWWVAAATAVMGKVVDRVADVVFPPPPIVIVLRDGAAIPHADNDDRDAAPIEVHDEEIGGLWDELADEVCPFALALLLQHLQPAPRRGARRARRFRLGLSARNSRNENSVYTMLGFFQLVGALLAAGTLSASALYNRLRASGHNWRATLENLAGDRQNFQLVFDTLYLQQLLRSIATLAALEDVAEVAGSEILPAIIADGGLTQRDDGLYLVTGRLFNPNKFTLPIPALCIDYVDGNGRPSGHFLVWPFGVGIEREGWLPFHARCPLSQD